MRGHAEGAATRRLLGLVAAEALLVAALAVAGLLAAGAPDTRAERAANRRLVAELRLTDLALWSGPSYCRHPSQTDLFAPFADHPGAFEHFPAGSLVPPPAPGGAAAGRGGVSGSPLNPPSPFSPLDLVRPAYTGLRGGEGGAPARPPLCNRPSPTVIPPQPPVPLLTTRSGTAGVHRPAGRRRGRRHPEASSGQGGDLTGVRPFSQP